MTERKCEWVCVNYWLCGMAERREVMDYETAKAHANAFHVVVCRVHNDNVLTGL